tara:strand:- start:42 stop:200 length:159 start_codon:yes stop_codon:yes gene_type:complete
VLGAQINKGGWHPECGFVIARIYNQFLASQSGFYFPAACRKPAAPVQKLVAS